VRREKDLCEKAAFIYNSEEITYQIGVEKVIDICSKILCQGCEQ